MTISNETLTAESPIQFTSSSFDSSLSSLKNHLAPKTPIYLILRPSTTQNNELIAVTYVPSTAPVRLKMLFASTRNSLTRDLGLEKFADNLFATDPEEILDPASWESRKKSTSRAEDMLSSEERELQGVRRAEEEARYGTSGKDLMGSGGSGGRLAMKINDDAKSAINQLKTGIVILGIDVSTETLVLLDQADNIDASAALKKIPSNQPSYAIFAYPGTTETVFVYSCPSSSKVKEKMVYASARAGVLQVIESEGLKITKRLEQGDTDEISEERLSQEVGLQANDSATVKQAFAKPKRPGRR